jgi:type IV secretion system protein TrbL
MGFWKKLGKIALPVGALAATIATGGAASPLLGMALGAGAGFGSGMLGGAGWKKSLIGAGIGGALGGIGGGALKGMGGLGKLGTQAAKYAPAAMQGAKGLAGGPAQQQVAAQGMGSVPIGGAQGYLNPIGLQAQRRTDMPGMGTRYYG